MESGVRYVYWDYTFDPVTREVTVRRWVKRGNLFAQVEVEYTQLTWDEALDVFEAEVGVQLLRDLSR